MTKLTLKIIGLTVAAVGGSVGAVVLTVGVMWATLTEALDPPGQQLTWDLLYTADGFVGTGLSILILSFALFVIWSTWAGLIGEWLEDRQEAQ